MQSLRSSHVRVDTRDVRSCDGLRQALEPALGLPFEGIVAPHVLVGVTAEEAKEQLSSLRNRDLVHCGTITQLERFCEGKNSILNRPEVNEQ